MHWPESWEAALNPAPFKVVEGVNACITPYSNQWELNHLFQDQASLQTVSSRFWLIYPLSDELQVGPSIIS